MKKKLFEPGTPLFEKVFLAGVIVASGCMLVLPIWYMWS